MIVSPALTVIVFPNVPVRPVMSTVTFAKVISPEVKVVSPPVLAKYMLPAPELNVPVLVNIVPDVPCKYIIELPAFSVPEASIVK